MRFAPRFSLRTLMILVVVVAIAIPATREVWRRFVLSRDVADHSAMMATKADIIADQVARSSSKSFAIDQGRPIPDDFVVLVRKGNVFGCFVPRKQHRTTESLEYDWY